MSSCAECTAKVELYLDGELPENERLEFLSQLETCSDCRKALEEAKVLSALVKSVRLSTTAPESLRENVLRMMREQPSTTNVESLPLVKKSASRWNTWIMAVAALICCAVGSILALAHLHRQSAAEDMIQSALLAHQGLEQHTLPLDVTSDSPQVVSAWFSGKVPFRFRMANAGIASDDLAKYKLVGGRLMTVRGEQAALLVFRLPDQMVSMLVASDRIAAAMGGKTMDSSGITFHSKDKGQFHIVSWNNQGLTYAMISRMSMGDKRSCVDCHATAHSGTNNPVASLKLHRWLASDPSLSLLPSPE